MTKEVTYTSDISGTESKNSYDFAPLKISTISHNGFFHHFDGHIHLDDIPEDIKRQDFFNSDYGLVKVIIIVSGGHNMYGTHYVNNDIVGLFITSDIQGENESRLYSVDELEDMYEEFLYNLTVLFDERDLVEAV